MEILKTNKSQRKPQDASSPAHLTKILVAVCIALMAVISSVSGLNVAQPMLALEFNASQNTVLWMINSYTLTLAAFLLPLGALGDRIGRKKILLSGLLIFGVASALSGMASRDSIMIVSRILSGIGAAMIMPVTLAVITSTFPEKERSRAIGIWTGVAGGGGILGMYLSAFLVDVATWRWLFLFPVVLALIALAMTIRFVPDTSEKNTGRFDTIGSLLSITATLGVIFALHELPEHGDKIPMVFLSLILGISSGIGFIVWELRHNSPLLNIRLFRLKSLSTGSVTLLVVFSVQAGIFIVLFPFFQGVLGWSGLRSTLALMPMALIMMVTSGLAPKLSLLTGIRQTMALGVLLSAIGAMLMAFYVSAETGYLSVLPGLIIMGAGMGLSMTPSTEAITSSLPPESQGVASALNDITRELGTALGVALLGPLVTAGYSSAIANKLKDYPEQTILKAREGLMHALSMAAGSGKESELLAQIARESFIAGWQQAIWLGAGIMTLLLVYIITGKSAKSTDKKANA